MPTESSMLSISESDGVDASPTADGDTPNSGRKKKVRIFLACFYHDLGRSINIHG